MGQVDQVGKSLSNSPQNVTIYRKIALQQGCGTRNKDGVQCRLLAKALPLDGQGMNHSRLEQSIEGKMPWCVHSVADFRSLQVYPRQSTLSLPSALQGGWVTRRKCLGSASVGLKTRCVAWRWWGKPNINQRTVTPLKTEGSSDS